MKLQFSLYTVLLTKHEKGIPCTKQIMRTGFANQNNKVPAN